MKRTKGILGCMAVVVMCVLVVSILRFGNNDEAEKVKIGFIMSGSIEESGWNGAHYQGISQAADELNVELIVKEDVLEFTGECEKAIRELADEGTKMIILSSYGYSEEVHEVVRQYPNIVFYGNSSEYHEDNLTSYFVRMYQARYLAGIIAGMRTQTNNIGYVAAMENNEVNRGINAFTLGVKSINSDAKVVVKWTNSWDNAEAEKEAVNLLIEKYSIDVVTYHQNEPNVIEAAENAVIDSIGYHIAVENASEHMLTAVVCDWKMTYKELIKEFLQGNGNSIKNYWIGIEKGVIGLASYSNFVTDEEKLAVDIAKEKILSGKEVFSGKIFDNYGNQKCNEHENISDEVLLEQMSWFVEGVEFYEE